MLFQIINYVYSQDLSYLVSEYVVIYYHVPNTSYKLLHVIYNIE